MKLYSIKEARAISGSVLWVSRKILQDLRSKTIPFHKLSSRNFSHRYGDYFYKLFIGAIGNKGLCRNYGSL